ncbi:pyrroloquinoline quinone precursor peptide PqqA [Nocardiopsis coralliicola]
MTEPTGTDRTGVQAPAWTTPDFHVVETALEVTAYFAAER